MDYHYNYPHPAVTTDCVVFGFDGVKLNVLLVERGNDPYKGSWAFPGGFLNIDEDAPDGARRELMEETGLHVTAVEQLGAFTAPGRDPRERVISIAYVTLMRMHDVQGADDAARAQWFPLGKVPTLAFDHKQIFEVACERLAQMIKLKTGDFMSDDFNYDEIDLIYYSLLTKS